MLSVYKNENLVKFQVFMVKKVQKYNNENQENFLGFYDEKNVEI